MEDYKIITKNDFIKMNLNRLTNFEIIGTLKEIKKNWNRIRKNYNFIIAVGKKGKEKFYSVDYFNSNIISNDVDLEELYYSINAE